MVDRRAAISSFRRSSFCSANGCVEVARGRDGGAVVRASADPRTALTFSADEWAAFLDGVKAGEFDVPQQRSAAD